MIDSYSYNPNRVIPWLMTYSEFKTLVDNDKQHPDNAYKSKIGTLDFQKKEKFNILVNTIKSRGVTFEIRARKEKCNYIKKADGEILRDKNNNAVYYTPSEVKKLNYKEYEISLGIWSPEEGDHCLGTFTDEWGAVLIQVVEEYRKFGLGTILGKLAYKLYPDKPTGGMTYHGNKAFTNIYREIVREALTTGKFMNAVKNDVISKRRAIEIIKSANLHVKFKNDDVGTNDPSNWLLFSPGFGSYLLYDRKLKDWIDDNEYHQTKAVKAGIHIEFHQEVGTVYSNHFSHPKLRKFMYALLWHDLQKENDTVLVEPEDYDIENHGFVLGEENNDYGRRGRLIKSGPTIDGSSMVKEEELFRRTFDRYGEFKDRLWELI